MKIDILTLFPEMFSPLKESIIKRAVEDGKIERKGAYVKPLNDLDCDLPIVNKALVDYMVEGVPVITTIYKCNDLKEFQKIVKISSKYMCGWHNGRKLPDKTFRVFASNDDYDTFIGKVKVKKIKDKYSKEPSYTFDEVVEKFANTPDHCFIMNCNVNGLPVPDNLDKSWYVKLAEKRLKAFGVR